MGFTLAEVVPWGRSYDEYVGMFALSERDLAGRILGCADGPASFNAGLTRRGGRIVSIDPLYAFEAPQIVARIRETFDKVMEQLRRNASDYLWTRFSSPEEVGSVRMKAMREFLADYDMGRAQGRYVACDASALPFTDASFDLALVSHFLFLYADSLSWQFHVKALLELSRVAREVRVFPLVTLDGRPYPDLMRVLGELEAGGVKCSMKPVPPQFQKGADKMLVLCR